jgi:hypothetical protein
MTQSQLAFIEEYLKDFNARAAARRAGYSSNSGPTLTSSTPIRLEIMRRMKDATLPDHDHRRARRWARRWQERAALADM